MKTQNLVLRVSLWVILAVLFIPTFSVAQPTFEVIGSHHITVVAKNYKYPLYHVSTYVEIKKNVAGILALSVTDQSTSGLDAYPDNTLILKDSNGFSGGRVRIDYIGNRADTSTQTIILFDGVSTRDTIWVTAYNTAFNDHEHPFALGGGYIFNNANQVKDVTALILNLTQDELSIKASLNPSAGAFSLDKSSFVIPPSSGTVVSAPLTVTFTPSGNVIDTAELTITAEHRGMSYSLGFKVVSNDSLYNEIPRLVCDTVWFLRQTMATKECKEFVIKNPTNYDVTITKAEVVAKNIQNFTAATLVTPLTIKAHQEYRSEICYTAPNEHNDYSIYDIQIEFQNPAGKKNSYQYPCAVGTTLECYTLTPEHSLVIPQTLPGGRMDRTFNVMNNLNETITINSVEVQDNSTRTGAFSLINTTFPISLESGATTTFGVRFMPPPEAGGHDNYWVTLAANISGSNNTSCSNFGYSVRGYIHSPYDSTIIRIFGSGEQNIPIYSTQNKIVRKIDVYSQAQKDIRVMSISCFDGTHFRVTQTNPATLPFVVEPGGHFVVWLEFDAGLGGIYDDQLVIVTEDAIQTFSVPIQGVRASTTSVKNSADENIQLSIAPNPSSAGVHISVSGATVRQTAIYNVLGTIVAGTSNMNEWTWDATANGERAADGTYFVRTEGVTADGTPFIKTEKLFLRKK